MGVGGRGRETEVDTVGGVGKVEGVGGMIRGEGLWGWG